MNYLNCTQQVFVFIFCSLIAHVATAQQQQSTEPGQETLTNKFVITHSGGYGGPVVKFSGINGEFAAFIGGYGGWFVNKQFMIGGGGYGLVGENIKVDEEDKVDTGQPDRDLHYTLGYGGFMVEYTMNSDKLVHYTFNTLIGGGGVSQALNNDREFANSKFFVFEPAANVEINVTDFFRIAAGASLRLVAGANTPGISNGDLSGLAGVLTFKFGYFD